MPRLLVLSLLIAIATTGCAGLKMTTIASDADERDAEGFRYYDTSPFLLIHTDSKGGVTSKVLYLPDTTKKRSIEPYAYGASNKTTFKFDKGRLTQAKAVVDETVVPVAVISALEKVAISLAKAANAGNDTLPGPYLYKIVKENGQWKLAGKHAVQADGTTPSTIRYATP